MRTVLALGVFALVALGCGGGDDDDAGDTGDSGLEAVGSDDDVESAGVDDDDDRGTGGDESGGALAASIAACDLFSVGDFASRGVGVASGPDQVEGDFGFDQCTFANDVGSAIVYVSVFPPADGAGATSDAEAIPGIGAEATYSPAGRAITVQLDDGSLISISIALSAPPEDPRDALIGLAELAAG